MPSSTRCLDNTSQANEPTAMPTENNANSTLTVIALSFKKMVSVIRKLS